MYYIYILFSESADKFYVGYIQDPKERLLKHNEQENFNTYTRKFRPWKMLRFLRHPQIKVMQYRLNALLKNRNQENFIEMLCDENSQLSGILAPLVRVPNIRD
jgi:putative endonuclease